MKASETGTTVIQLRLICRGESSNRLVSFSINIDYMHLLNFDRSGPLVRVVTLLYLSIALMVFACDSIILFLLLPWQLQILFHNFRYYSLISP